MAAAVGLAGCSSGDLEITGSAEPYQQQYVFETRTEIEASGIDSADQSTQSEGRATLERTSDGSLVLTLDDGTTGARRYDLAADTAGRPAGVASVSGVPLEALDGLRALSLVPDALIAPPDDRVRPGLRWSSRHVVDVGGSSIELSAVNRITALGRASGDATYETRSVVEAPLDLVVDLGGPRARLTAQMRTTVTTTRSADDGRIIDSTVVARMVGTASFAPPPDAADAAPVETPLVIRQRSRLRPI